MHHSQAVSADSYGDDPYEKFHGYDFSADQQFMSGWKAIDTDITPELKPDRLLQAKIFYYSKFHHLISKEKYKEWCQKNGVEMNKYESNDMDNTSTDGAKTEPKLPADDDIAQADDSTTHSTHISSPTEIKTDIPSADEFLSLNSSLGHLSVGGDSEQTNQKSDNNTSAVVEGKESALSFAEIMELVQSGQPIPGVETLNIEATNQEPTTSSLPRILKPWEKTQTD